MAFLSVALVNLAIIGLTAYVFHITGSLWSFLLLFFFMTAKKHNKEDD